MVIRLLALSLIVLSVAGCGHKDADVTITGEDGTKVSVNTRDGNGKTTVTGLNGEKMEVDTKNGQSTMSGTDKNGEKISAAMGANTTFTEAELGVPFYPGSTERPNEQMMVDAATEKDFMSSRTTTDEPSKVADFYKDKVKGGSTSTMSMNGSTMAICSGNLDSGAKFSLTAERKDGSKETIIKIGVGIKK